MFIRKKALLLLCNHNILGFMEEIGKIIKERRKLLKIKQQELADLAGISINTLTKIERGESNPSINKLIAILDTLGLELSIQIKKK